MMQARKKSKTRFVTPLRRQSSSDGKQNQRDESSSSGLSHFDFLSQASWPSQPEKPIDSESLQNISFFASACNSQVKETTVNNLTSSQDGVQNEAIISEHVYGSLLLNDSLENTEINDSPKPSCEVRDFEKENDENIQAAVRLNEPEVEGKDCRQQKQTIQDKQSIETPDVTSKRSFKVPMKKKFKVPKIYKYTVGNKGITKGRSVSSETGGKKKRERKLSDELGRKQNYNGSGTVHGAKQTKENIDYCDKDSCTNVYEFPMSQKLSDNTEKPTKISKLNHSECVNDSLRLNMSITGRTHEEQLAMDLEILDLISQTRVEIQDIRNKYNTALYDSSLIMAMNKSIQEPQHKYRPLELSLFISGSEE